MSVYNNYFAFYFFSNSIISEIRKDSKFNKFNRLSNDELCSIISQINNGIFRIKKLNNVSIADLLFAIGTIFVSLIVNIERINKKKIDEEHLLDFMSNQLKYLRSKQKNITND